MQVGEDGDAEAVKLVGDRRDRALWLFVSRVKRLSERWAA